MTRILAAAVVAATLTACAHDPAPPPADAPPPPTPVRSRMESNRDDALKAMIERRLAADRQATRAVVVEVWQGRVLLMGAVTRPDHRRKAEQAARAVEGVAEVLNELVLAEDRALELFAPDPGRDEAVRRALGLEGRAGITVRVINGVAFLLGAAASPEQADRLKADALDVDGVKWAVPHLRTP